MKANIKLIQLFTDNDLTRQYAVFLQLKQLHAHSTFYNYSPNSLQCKAGISRNTIKKYIDFYIRNGWAYMHGKNLTLIAHNKLKRLYNITLKNDIKINAGAVNQIIASFRQEILKHKYDQFIHLRNKSSDLLNPSNLAIYKRAVKWFRKTNCKPFVDVNQEYYKVSNNKLSQYINKSSATLSRLIKSLEADKKVKVIRQSLQSFVLSPKDQDGQICKHLPGGSFFYKNKLIVVQCNKYAFF